MAVNADQELADLPVWSVIIGGREYAGRPLSWPAYRRFELAVKRANGDADGLRLAARDALRAAFPVRWQYVVRPSRDPVSQILALPPAVQAKVLTDFFEFLASPSEATASDPVAPTSAD